MAKCLSLADTIMERPRVANCIIRLPERGRIPDHLAAQGIITPPRCCRMAGCWSLAEWVPVSILPMLNCMIHQRAHGRPLVHYPQIAKSILQRCCQTARSLLPVV